MKRPLAVIVAAAMVSVSPPASAGVGCVHRGGAHAARHGGQAEDDRYHLSRGELPTCDGDQDRDDNGDSAEPVHVSDPVRDPARLPRDHDRHCWERCNKWWRND